MASDNLKQKTAKGLFWAVLNNGATQVLNLVFGIFLGRLLSPEEYGIVGVLAIFIAIAGDLQSAGFTQALINIKHPTDRDYNSVFSFNVSISVIMYAILFLCAPLIADFFHQPCLTSVSRFLFIALPVSSLGIASGGYMLKNMMNKEFAVIAVIALLCSGTVGIVLALMGASYWALAWQQVVFNVVTTIGKHICVMRRWKPRLSFDFGPVKSMVPFALKILITKIVTSVSNNVLTFIFGRLFPIRQVGNYSQAFKWDTMAHSLVSNSMGQISQTILVEASVNEESNGVSKVEDRSLRVFRKMLRFTCFLAMPVMFGLALVSQEFIVVTIGKQWLECVPLLQVLCISGAFMPLHSMYQNLAISQGRSDLFMWLNVLQILLQILIILSFYSFGMTIMVIAYSIFLILWLLPWHFLVGRLIGYTLLQAMSDLLPFLVVSVVTMLLTYFSTISIELPILNLCLRIFIAAILYYAIMKLLRVQILSECEKFVMGKLR